MEEKGKAKCNVIHEERGRQRDIGRESVHISALSCPFLLLFPLYSAIVISLLLAIPCGLIRKVKNLAVINPVKGPGLIITGER